MRRVELRSSWLLAITCKMPSATTIVALHLLLQLVLPDLLARAGQNLLLEPGLLDKWAFVTLLVTRLFARKRLLPGSALVLALALGLALAVSLVDFAVVTTNARLLQVFSYSLIRHRELAGRRIGPLID